MSAPVHGPHGGWALPRSPTPVFKRDCSNLRKAGGMRRVGAGIFVAACWEIVAGLATTGGVRPSSDGSKRSGSRYVLGDLLGRGGMAEVFAGHAVGDHGFQKPVAIKR